MDERRHTIICYRELRDNQKDTDICIHTKEKDHISKNKKVDQATLLTEESKTE